MENWDTDYVLRPQETGNGHPHVHFKDSKDENKVNDLHTKQSP